SLGVEKLNLDLPALASYRVEMKIIPAGGNLSGSELRSAAAVGVHRRKETAHVPTRPTQRSAAKHSHVGRSLIDVAVQSGQRTVVHIQPSIRFDRQTIRPDHASA